MSMSRWGRWGYVAAGLALAGCGGGAASAGPGAPSGNVEIYSWWTSGSEQSALHAFLSEYAKRYPNVSVINAA